MSRRISTEKCPALAERAGKIPGAVEIRTVQDQDRILNELQDYTARNGTLPPLGGSGTPEENRLASWMRNNTRASAEGKTPRLRARHEAILELMAKYPARSEALEAGRLQELASSRATVIGRLRTRTPTSPNGALPIWLANHEDSKDRRVVEALQAPSRTEHQWLQNFEALKAYVAAHDGRIPGNWHEGRIFSWLTVQRRQYRRGKMSAERIEKLLTVDGILPGKTLLADAA